MRCGDTERAHLSGPLSSTETSSEPGSPLGFEMFSLRQVGQFCKSLSVLSHACAGAAAGAAAAAAGGGGSGSPPPFMTVGII